MAHSHCNGVLLGALVLAVGSGCQGAATARGSGPRTAVDTSGKPAPAPAPVAPGSPDARPPVSRASTDGGAVAAPASRPAPWSTGDIGAPATEGKLTVSNTVFTIKAGGADIGGTSDSFFLTYLRLHGDGEIVAKVKSLQMIDPASKAGLMIRAGNEPAAANVLLAVLGDTMKGGHLQHRAAAGGPTITGPSDPGVKAGQWLRLVRSGKRFSAYRSGNRTNWFDIGAVEVDMPPEVLVGLAVTAKNPTAATTAEFDGLRAHNLDSHPPTRGWNLEDLGTMGGSAVVKGGGVTVSGMGEPSTLGTEFGTLAFDNVSGSRTITARVTALDNSNDDATARAGLTFREGLPTNVNRSGPHVLLAVTRAGALTLQSRAATNTNNAVVMAKEPVKLPLWLRLQKSDDPEGPSSLFTAAYSADGKQWTALDPVTLALPEPFLAGVLVAPGNTVNATSATLTDLTLTGSPAVDAGAPPPADAGPETGPTPDAAPEAGARLDGGKADGRRG